MSDAASSHLDSMMVVAFLKKKILFARNSCVAWIMFAYVIRF